MDLWTQIQFLTIPTWLRIFIVLLTAILFSICLYMFASAFLSPDNPSWMEAGAYLTGVIFPIVLVIVFISGVQSGVPSIQNGLDIFLTQTIPGILAKLPEQPTVFHDWNDVHKNPNLLNDAPVNVAQVSVSHTKNNCYADYKIDMKTEDNENVSLCIRLEVNVKRVNFNLYLNPDVVSKPAGIQAGDNEQAVNRKLVDFLMSSMASSLFFAEMALKPHVENVKDKAEKKQPDGGGYVVNKDKIYQRKLNGKKMYLLVASRPVSSDMLWHSAEKLYFAQDLMFMIRAIVQEAPFLFKSADVT